MAFRILDGGIGVFVGVEEGVLVGVEVAVGVFVDVAFGVLVGVAVEVAVLVAVADGSGAGFSMPPSCSRAINAIAPTRNPPKLAKIAYVMTMRDVPLSLVDLLKESLRFSISVTSR